ncbi:hypothetical protein Tco_0581458, partial [Tanacetum coccineum]
MEYPDVKGIDSSFCTHKILMEDKYKPSVQPQRRVNLNIKEVVKKEVIKLLDAGLIYPISDSSWVSHVQVVPKKGGMTVVKNEKDELIPQRTVTGWRIPIAPEDQDKTTFACPYGTFAYRRMPFELCNASSTFQRCLTAIFHELIEDSMDVFMEDFSVFDSSFNHFLKNLEKIFKRYLGKLTKAEIRDIFPEERLMAISDKNNELMSPSYSNNVLTKSYEGAWPEMRQHKFFNNVTVDHLEDIMTSPPPQVKSSRPERGDEVTIYTRRRHHDTCDGVRIFLMASNAVGIKSLLEVTVVK